MTESLEVVIAGGGVAALEAVLAIRQQEQRPTSIELLSPVPEFRLQAMSVAEPFGGDPHTLDLGAFCAEHDVAYRPAALAEVWGGQQRILSDRGDEVFYDALLLATGAQRSSVVPGTHPFRGAADVKWFETLLERLERGAISDVVFAVPRRIKWTLPIWELAMLTSNLLAERGREAAEITVVTHEAAPLEVLGAEVSGQLAEVLAEAGVGLQAGVGVVRFDRGVLRCEGGREIKADEVVSLPGLSVPEIPGIPQGRHGFVGCDAEMRVDGLDRVWVAGDSAWFPIKQGGLAAQQAGIAAAGILREAGVDVDVPAFSPIMRGALITGGKPRFMRVRIGEEAGGALTKSPLWWPPIKVAGERLGPYLARHWSLAEEEDEGPGMIETEDLDPAADEREHEAALQLALDFADIDAREGDYGDALRWLEVAERLNVTLPPDYVQRRADWRAAATG